MLTRVLGRTAEATAGPLYTAGIASLVLGAFCLTLPHTPPPARGQKVSLGSILGFDAFRELGSWPIRSTEGMGGGAWYLPDIDQRRLKALARNNAYWIKRYVGA